MRSISILLLACLAGCAGRPVRGDFIEVSSLGKDGKAAALADARERLAACLESLPSSRGTVKDRFALEPVVAVRVKVLARMAKVAATAWDSEGMHVTLRLPVDSVDTVLGTGLGMDEEPLPAGAGGDAVRVVRGTPAGRGADLAD